jgi:8-oxo-dGTP diphosphatase
MKETNFGTAGCVIKDNKVLLIHRTSSFDVWEFPGGGIEFGESPEEAAVREVKEETNLTVKSKGLLAIKSYLSPQGKHYIGFLYVCDVLDGEVKIGDDDHSEYQWFSFNEIKNISNLSLGVKHVMPELQKILGD